METWGHGNMGGMETWGHGNMGSWKHGRHGNMGAWTYWGMETWGHGNIGSMEVTCCLRIIGACYKSLVEKNPPEFSVIL